MKTDIWGARFHWVLRAVCKGAGIRVVTEYRLGAVSLAPTLYRKQSAYNLHYTSRIPAPSNTSQKQRKTILESQTITCYDEKGITATWH